jgi:hypothetical protein
MTLEYVVATPTAVTVARAAKALGLPDMLVVDVN